MNRISKWIQEALEKDESRSKWRRFLGIGVLAGLGAIVLRSGSVSIISTVAILAGASLFVGILIGFLFGIPKTSQRKVDTGTSATLSEGDYQPNTNLEDISDWLTKMLVGIGLVELREVPHAIDQIAEYCGASLGPTYPKAYIAGVLVYFSTIGFLIGYLWTRLALVGDFIDKDPRRLIGQILSGVAQAAQRNPDATDRSPRREVITPQELDAARKLASLSAESRVSLDELRRQVQALAAEYETVRGSMPSGGERTRRMEVVASQMRSLSIAAYPLLSELARSSSPGERLAAIAFLQTRPHFDYLDWLVSRIREEVPFIGYHAAVALQHAARAATPKQREVVGLAIEQASLFVPDDTDRSDVLRDAFALLKDKPS